MNWWRQIYGISLTPFLYSTHLGVLSDNFSKNVVGLTISSASINFVLSCILQTYRVSQNSCTQFISHNALDSHKQSWIIFVIQLEATEPVTPALGCLKCSRSQIYSSERHVKKPSSLLNFHQYMYSSTDKLLQTLVSLTLPTNAEKCFTTCPFFLLTPKFSGNDNPCMKMKCNENIWPLKI